MNKEAYADASYIVDVGSNIVSIIGSNVIMFLFFCIILIACAYVITHIAKILISSLMRYIDKRAAQQSEQKIKKGSGADFAGIIQKTRVRVDSYANWHPLMRRLIESDNFSVHWQQDTLGGRSSISHRINKGSWFDGMVDNSHQTVHDANGHKHEVALVDRSQYEEDGIRNPVLMFDNNGYLILLEEDRKILTRNHTNVFSSQWKYAGISDMIALLGLIQDNTVLMRDFSFFAYDGDMSCSADRDGNGTIFVTLHKHKLLHSEFLPQLYWYSTPIVSRNI